MNEGFEKLLKNIDLTTTQIKIYLFVLSNGLSSVLQIATETKIARSQIYSDTNLLVERGVLELASKRKRRFLAVRPDKLSNIVEDKLEKLSKLKNILPQAAEYFSTKKFGKESGYKIRFFEGISQVAKAMQYELEDVGAGEILVAGGFADVQEEIFGRNFWIKWHQKLTKQNGRCRMIIDKQSGNFDFYKQSNIGNTVVRGLSNFRLETNFAVWNDKVVVTIYNKNPVSIILESKLLAKSYRDIFELLWKISN